MRIAIANWTRSIAGGAEEYLARLTPVLAARGHALAFFSETAGSALQQRIPLSQDASTWTTDATSRSDALGGLKGWRPDIIYCNGMTEIALEREFATIAPAVFSMHGYHGTCISGRKMHSFPKLQTCTRRFGPACLALYLPRRCGGLNPVTMASEYRRQDARLRILNDYRAIVVHSDHMVREYARHGIRAKRIHYPIESVPHNAGTSYRAAEMWRLLFIGRMTWLKGGWLLLAAARLAQARLGTPLTVTLAGDGPERGRWEEESRSMPADVQFRFVGWVDSQTRADLLSTTDLLVVPSVWPEPFGMVGLEAAAHGVPSVAFAVGGIPDWLTDGVNGVLANSDPPTAAGLADAIVRCLANVTRYREFRQEAKNVYESFSLSDPVGELLTVFEQVIGADTSMRTIV